jgi:HEAT repeat protein
MVGHWLQGRRVLGGLVLVAVLAAVAGVGWLQRGPVLAWFYLHGLARAGEAERGRWAERVAGLGEPAVAGLIDALADPDPRVCQNTQAGLARLAADWGAADPRSVDLAGRLARAFPQFSAPGQRAALEVASRWFPPGTPTAPAPGLVPACGRSLESAASASDVAIQAAALDLAARLLAQPAGPAEVIRPAREAVCAGLRSADPANRHHAVRLALRPGMDLLDQVVPLLQDPAAEVRRAAVVALGQDSRVVREEGLLPCLHDPDPEVRRLCEMALRGRGMPPEHLKIGRKLTDPNPLNRLRVLDHLGDGVPDLDPGLWLRRLSHDSSPAVRVAALRVMSQQNLVDLTDRIDQMARSDPSPTVAQLARFYLGQTPPHPRLMR